MYKRQSLHNENGAWQMIFGVDTIPEYRCRGCAAALLNHVIEMCIRDRVSGLLAYIM